MDRGRFFWRKKSRGVNFLCPKTPSGNKPDAIDSFQFQAGKDDDDFVKEQDIQKCNFAGPWGSLLQEGKSFPKAHHVNSLTKWMGKKGGFPKKFPQT